MLRVGIGYDIHPLVEGRPLVLGGLTLPGPRGLLGHSDGDALIHAVIDALLGAAGLGDIGQHFPDSDPRWQGAPSARFVGAVLALVRGAGLAVVNVDLTLLAEAPRIGPHREAIRREVARLLELPPGRVNLKATTTEGLGFLGRAEGLAAQAVVLLAGD